MSAPGKPTIDELVARYRAQAAEFDAETRQRIEEEWGWILNPAKPAAEQSLDEVVAAFGRATEQAIARAQASSALASAPPVPPAPPAPPAPLAPPLDEAQRKVHSTLVARAALAEWQLVRCDDGSWVAARWSGTRALATDADVEAFLRQVGAPG